MILTKNDLLKWLKEIDNKLDKSVTLVAIGGTAMTLLGLKESTRDVDFDVSREELDVFKRVSKGAFEVHIYADGFIFSEQLPEDYVSLAKEYKEIIFRNIKLRILNPIDIIITKAARYNARDGEDIAVLIKKIKIDKDELIERFEKVIDSYAGSEENFRYNFNFVLKRHFS